MEAMLLQAGTETDLRWLLGSYFQAKSWTAAQDLLHSMPYETDDQRAYKDAMQINLTALEVDYQYTLSDGEHQLLRGIALGNTPSRAFAISTLALLKGERFPVVDDELPPIDGLTIGGTNTESALPFARLYPNPGDEFINLKLSGAEWQKGARYRILDIRGAVLQEWTNCSDIENRIDLTALKSGIFFLELSIGNQSSETFKFIRL